MARAGLEQRTMEAVERVCREASTADVLLEGLADEIHRAIPHDGSTWFGVDPVTLLATEPSRIEALDASLCDTYWHLEFHEQDTGLFSDLAHGGNASALRLSLDDRPGRSIRYRDFMQPQGYEDELRGVFKAGSSTWGVVGLYREGGRPAFSPEEVELLNGLSGLVARALRTHILAAGQWVGPPSAPGLIVLDRQGDAISANAEALRWLQELWPVARTHVADDVEPFEALRFRGRELEAPTALFALVSRARAVAEGRERTPARVRLRDRRGRWLVLHASALTGPDEPMAGSVAVVIEAAKSAEIAPIIIEAYSLTSRERDVLGCIARGESTAEIAAGLFLSPHTVRDHVKTVFEKVGVSSRGELVAKLFGEHYAEPLHASMVHLH